VRKLVGSGLELDGNRFEHRTKIRRDAKLKRKKGKGWMVKALKCEGTKAQSFGHNNRMGEKGRLASTLAPP
jgi:hypothetical protein